MGEIDDLHRFYDLLDRLETKLGGKLQLAACGKGSLWPEKGIYFFFELGEHRRDSGKGYRVVGVGGNAIRKETAKATLWQRLAEHRGNKDGMSGKHRASLFRRQIGLALGARFPELMVPTWERMGGVTPLERNLERPLEGRVSLHIGAMPFLWLKVEDDPATPDLRGYLVRNAIALVSNAKRAKALDPPSKNWLGLECPTKGIAKSGLWNPDFVTNKYDAQFLEVLSAKIAALDWRR